MITAAVILLPKTEDCPPLTMLGGLSLLKRAIFTAQRAGAQTCYLVSDSNAEEVETLRRSLQGDLRLSSHIVWVTQNEEDKQDEQDEQDEQDKIDVVLEELTTQSTPDHCVVFQVQTLLSVGLARGLAGSAAPHEVWGVSAKDLDYALILFPLQQLRAALTRLQREPSLAEDRNWGAEIKPFDATGFFLHHVSRAAAAPEAEKALLLSLPNPKDGLVDAYLNRKLSRPLTRLFLRTSLTPNQITLLSCSIGLIGAACFWGGGYGWPILGGLLLQFSAVVDCIDGEVARVKFLESPFGAWLDITLDTVVHIAIFLGVGIAVWKQGGGTSAPLFGGALAVGAALSFPFVTMAEKTEEQGKQQGGWDNTIIRNMIEGLTSRDYSIIILLCVLIQKLSWFLWGAAIGVQVFWVTLAVLLRKTGRMNWGVFSSRSQDA